MEYTPIIHAAKRSAAALRAFEAAFMGIIEDPTENYTTDDRDMASELFYVAFDSAMDAACELTKISDEFAIYELYTQASEADKSVIKAILGKYQK